MEESKKKETQKNGIDYLIKQGYKKLSAKTFISDVELEHFLNKDFTNINKTRALGFIQILEREYDVDLGDLRSAYLDHENSHKVKEPDTLFIETPIKKEKEWQKYLPHVGGALVVLGLAFYLLRPGVDTVEIGPLTKQLEENKSVIKEAQKSIEKLEENKSAALTVSALENSLEDETNLSSATVENDDLDLDKVVLQMMKERNITAEEHNISLDLNATNDGAGKIKPNKPAAKPAATKSEVKQVKKQTPKKKKATVGDLYIKPLQKAWVGVIYLDNFTKKDFLIRTKLPLDSSRDQLIVVGHGKFKIYNKTYYVKFRGKGPVRFIYKDGELMEISKKEFIKTSAGVGW